MTNSDLIRRKIQESGLKMQYISAEMGISRQALTHKLKTNGSWTYQQARTLQRLLGLSMQEMNDIFFAA